MTLKSQIELPRSLDSYPIGAKLGVEGRFERKIFSNEANGYKIYVFDAEKIIDEDGTEHVTSDSICITGYYEADNMSRVLPCRVFGTIGSYKGEKQLAASRMEIVEPVTLGGIVAFLGSGIIPGIREKTAENIVRGFRHKGVFVEGFGESTLAVIKDDHLALTRIKGITQAKALQIHEAYMENMEYQNVMMFFQKYGISPSKVMAIYGAYKGRSVELALENPFIFTNIKGFGFKTCDEIARRIGLDVHSHDRIREGILYTLEDAEAGGHCYLTRGELVRKAGDNLSIAIPLLQAREECQRGNGGDDERVTLSVDGLSYELKRMELEDRIGRWKGAQARGRHARVVLDEVSGDEIEETLEAMLRWGLLMERPVNENGISAASTGEVGQWDDDSAIYGSAMYHAESDAAASILRIASSEPSMVYGSIDHLIGLFEEQKGFLLEERQKEAVRSVFGCNLLVLTGSAGSGKTTTVECMIYVLNRLMPSGDGKSGEEGTDEEEGFMLAAPTGKAAKRLTEVTGLEARTIHRLLQYTGDRGSPYYHAGNPLPYKVIVIDEASMLDIHLARDLFSAIRRRTKVVLIGDIQQLPSVGPGNILNDIIRSGVIPVVELDVIKRQADGSGIITNANRIIKGQLPDVDCGTGDFYFIEEADKHRVVKKTLDSLTRLMSRYDYTIDDIQVICPQKASEIGVYEMNKAIQQLVNPPASDKAEVRRGNSVFRTGDKVIHLNNNYDAAHHIKGNTLREYAPKGGTGVYNGDIGRIIGIFQQKEDMNDEEEEGVLQVAVQYDDFIILYDKQELEDLDLAYSLTVHKMQGSQCEAAIILLHMRNYVMLYRNLGYTAVTRAKKMVCIIGQKEALSLMVENVKVTQRNTLLWKLLGQA